MKNLCILCDAGTHTSPPNGSSICTCGMRTCACYGMQVKAGVRKDKAQR